MIVCSCNQKIIAPFLSLLAGLILVVSLSLPAHATRMGGMSKMKGGEGIAMRSPEERAAEIAEKLTLSEEQQIEVVYLLENMFRKQSEYEKQARESDELSRTEVMEQMKAARVKTIEQVGDFLNDDQLSQLTELLTSSMERPAGGRPSGIGGGAGRPFESY